ncbi:PREDICTED: uncharacterized protein LOC108364018 [Rhagoletis zephyria]|uniref:uncharacterized protein LOC108364018 n=1 Tax=Rhagoletis zephyria TaxID=28612 RepID=UPI000811263D|nr:PREDICTED: uncharacterized protein LOC108364018 [Rhagoletis zephyria]
MSEQYSKEDLDNLFEQLNHPRSLEEENIDDEYVPEALTTTSSTPISKYVPTPLTAGPKPLTIEAYKKRQIKNDSTEHSAPKQKIRGGKAVKLRRKIGELHRVIPLATGENKRKLIAELIELKKNKHNN